MAVHGYPAAAEFIDAAQALLAAMNAALAKKGIRVEVFERVHQVGPNKVGATGTYTIYPTGVSRAESLIRALTSRMVAQSAHRQHRS